MAPAAAAIGPRAEAPGSYLTRLEQASLRGIARTTCMTFPYIRGADESGRLALHGAYFDVPSGELTALDPATGRFVRVGAHERASARRHFRNR